MGSASATTAAATTRAMKKSTQLGPHDQPARRANSFEPAGWAPSGRLAGLFAACLSAAGLGPIGPVRLRRIACSSWRRLCASRRALIGSTWAPMGSAGRYLIGSSSIGVASVAGASDALACPPPQVDGGGAPEPAGGRTGCPEQCPRPGSGTGRMRPPTRGGPRGHLEHSGAGGVALSSAPKRPRGRPLIRRAVFR